MSWRISFEIIGDAFAPSKVKFDFTAKNEVNDIQSRGRFKGIACGYGSASYVVPKRILSNDVFRHLADTFQPMLEELKECGAEDWHISINRSYFAQCNEELSSDDIQQLGRLNCSVAYSAYEVEEEDEGW